MFELIYSRILDECYKHGFVDPSEVFVDATHVKACANIHKKEKGIARQEAISEIYRIPEKGGRIESDESGTE